MILGAPAENKTPINPYSIVIKGKNYGSDSELVSVVENEFKEALRAHSVDISLMYECWNAYFAINAGQWEQKKLIALKNEDREPRSYDIISPKVDTLAGALISELPDMEWTPVEGQKSTATEAIKDSWISDKELTNSEYELMLTIRDGLVHSGWIQLIETGKYGKPTIGFQRIMPGFFVPSPYWVQESDRQMESCFRIGYLTPSQMMKKYKSKEGEIQEAIDIIRRRGHEELPSNAYDMRRMYIGRIADHYRIVENHYIEQVKTTRLLGLRNEIDPNTGEPIGMVRWVPFPVTKDRQQLEYFAAVNQIDWETVEESPYEDVVHKVRTIVPDFDRSIVLEDSTSKIQTKGLPFHHFTVTRFNGRNKGIVASMLDLQRTLNERENMVSELINKANGGSSLVDKNLFKDPKDQETFDKNSNKPGYKHYVDMDDSRTANPVVSVGSNQYPSQVLDQINRLYDRMVPLLSRVSDSMSAVTNSGKSGVLFEKEIQVNRIGNLLMDKGIKNMMNNMGESYFYQWQIAYEGIPREITSRDGKRKTVLNERFYDSNGREMIRNAVGQVPRVRVIVTESINSPTNQMKNRMIYSEVLKGINPDTNPEHYNFVFNEFMSTLDLPEKVKAKLEALNKRLDIKAMMQHVQSIMTIHAGTKMAGLEAANADMQLQMIMQQLQGSQPQPAIPEQLNEAAEEDFVQPAGPASEPQSAVGSDISDASI